ncbi:hypothetical protein PVAG01_04598 [Phlyctema vagabunda]|uniref:Uncharacterized protein n=1 Tax=Phlyctema vagabunda TaxID=108571 RepID=A0ABR4PHN9_9HELO
MSYQNYLDSPQGTPNSNSRQAPPSPAQNMNPNGMNGGMGMGAGYPTPAGHQQDLNHIMQMVENLSAQLAQNNAMTSNIVEMTGRVREIAQKHNLTNEELIVLSAHSIDGQARNLDKELSELEKKYDAACYDREEWKKLSVYCCQVLSNILDLARDFKFKHEADTLTWHRNYRDQLAAEREENLKLRCEINDMRAAAIRSNTHMNDLRRHISDSKAFYEQEVRITQWRQQARFWKRMAMPYLPDDDPEFSDDDDIIDPEEKKRLQAEKEAKEGEGEGGASAN